MGYFVLSQTRCSKRFMLFCESKQPEFSPDLRLRICEPRVRMSRRFIASRPASSDSHFFTIEA